MKRALVALLITAAAIPPHWPGQGDEPGCWWPPGLVANQDRGHFPGGLGKLNRFVDHFPEKLCGRAQDGHPNASGPS